MSVEEYMDRGICKETKPSNGIPKFYDGMDKIQLFYKRNYSYAKQLKRRRWTSLRISINTNNKDYYLIFYYSADSCPGIGIWHYVVKKTPQFAPKFTTELFNGNNYSDPEEELYKVMSDFKCKYISIYDKIEDILYKDTK